MITEEEYKQYNEEIDEFIEKYLKEHKTSIHLTETDEWKKEFRVKALKVHEYSLIREINEYYYYSMFPEKYKTVNIKELQNEYNENLGILNDLKYALKVFETNPYIRIQIVDDDMTPSDIKREIRRTERTLNTLEYLLNGINDNKIQKVRNTFTNKYYKCKRDLEKVQKELSKLENTEK